MICGVETILSNKTTPAIIFYAMAGIFLRKNTVDSRG